MRLTKHHGLGNDFLVVDDRSGAVAFDTELARAVCDRHRGVGADGLLRLGPGGSGTDVAMQLRNADGGLAEMSGNGLACLAQAALLAGAAAAPVVTVATDAGRRTVHVAAGPSPHAHAMTVEVGAAKIGDDQPAWAGGAVRRALAVDMGNPHLVLEVDDPDAVDLVALGQRANAEVPGGVNVELVAADAAGALRMWVYERGVGLTEACGTGACATAAAAHHWGLAGTEVVVQQPGGAVTIRVGDPITMTVPVVHVADLDWLDGGR